MARRFARSYTRTTDALLQRVWNWSRMARQNPDIPRVAMSSIYDLWVPNGAGRDEGWGAYEAPPMVEEFDADDAEVMTAWILQLAGPHKVTIVCRFVLDKHVHHLEIDAALRALEDLMYASDRVIDRMEGR